MIKINIKHLSSICWWEKYVDGRALLQEVDSIATHISAASVV